MSKAILCIYRPTSGVSINLVKKHLNRNLDIEGAVLTMYDSRTNLSNQVVKEANMNL